jgi:hypothetical protein
MTDDEKAAKVWEILQTLKGVTFDDAEHILASIQYALKFYREQRKTEYDS